MNRGVKRAVTLPSLGSHPSNPYPMETPDMPRKAEGASIIVPDPIQAGAWIKATRNTRDDRLAWLHAHNQIEEWQFQAGRRFQNDWQAAERGARAIDPTKEHVDGGQLPEPLSQRQGEARLRLVEIERALGKQAYRIVFCALIEEIPMEQVAMRYYGSGTEFNRKYCGRVFRDALDTLAEEYGLSTKRK